MTVILGLEDRVSVLSRIVPVICNLEGSIPLGVSPATIVCILGCSCLKGTSDCSADPSSELIGRIGAVLKASSKLLCWTSLMNLVEPGPLIGRLCEVILDSRVVAPSFSFGFPGKVARFGWSKVADVGSWKIESVTCIPESP